VLIALVASCTLVEAVLQLSDAGLIVPRGLRAVAYEYGAFWPALLGSWRPNYALQPWTMFATYALLHGGIWHLVFNMITLWSLGQAVAREVGTRGLVGLYVAGTLGGGVAQGLLSDAPNPMVGASGALFGLVAGLIWLQLLTLRRRRASLRPVVLTVAVLVAINVVMWWGLDGRLAWQAHLGGFLAGIAVTAGRHGLPR
jgi:membrane associated rhomboid family serine protease